jgi:multiple sugar transport system ATP-binding protein
VTTRNELVKQQHELGTTTIYVTHDQVEAMTMGDRICIMNGGEVIQIGKPLEVYRNPLDTFVARFLGNPPMNLMTAQLERQAAGYRLQAGSSAFEVAGYAPAALAPYAGGPVILGIRPEDLYEESAGPGGGMRAPMRFRIQAVEPLGAETLLMLAAGSGEEITARIGRDTGLRLGEEADLFLDTGAIHLFDPKTTKAIPREL